MYSNETFEPKILEKYFLDQSSLHELRNPICIMGVPDLTDLGLECTRYLIDQLNPEKILTINYSDFYAVCHINTPTGITELTSIDFYLLNGAENENDVIIVTGDGLPTSPIGINYLAEKIAEIISSFKPKHFLSITSALTPHPSLHPKTYLALTSEVVLSTFKNTNLKFDLFEKGLVIGLNGLAIGYAKELFNLEGGILLAEMFKSDSVDFKSVKAILEALNIVLKIEINLDSIKKKIKESIASNDTNPPPTEEILKKMRERIQN